ncbi:MAG: hypothetical protein V3V48_07340 [Candidatus Aminicenantaceae bacterium]|jgi:putative ABC transport system permease protein
MDSGYYMTPRMEDFKGAPFINVITMDHDFISEFDIQLISIVVSSPIAWFSMNKWLQDFAYRIHMSPVAFLRAAGGALVLAIATVSIQGIRTAVTNPSNSLRNE